MPIIMKLQKTKDKEKILKVLSWQEYYLQENNDKNALLPKNRGITSLKC